ncbi:unnamed protein product [Discula destructiva]
MVSLWPFRKDDNSPATFEKALSVLSAKITATQSQLDRTRASHRRLKVLSTLYLSFAYLVYAIVALLVVGWNHMGAYEWSGMAGGPVFIYLVRTISSTVYELRIEALNSKLKDQQAERAKTIQKLKDATRYDSTAELLEKYGGGEARPKAKKKSKDDGQDENPKKDSRTPMPQNTRTPDRTNLPIPPTANIQRRSNPGTPQAGTGPYTTPQQHHMPSSNRPLEPTAEFSPNAFDSARPRPSPDQYETPNHWYDRIMDLLLGEDETAPKNRFVLICKRCRLVNGQAPPGTNSLAELGLWKCMGCGTSNGEVDEGKKLVKQVLAQRSERGTSTDGGHDEEDSSDLVEVQSVEARTEEDDDDVEEQGET